MIKLQKPNCLRSFIKTSSSILAMMFSLTTNAFAMVDEDCKITSRVSKRNHPLEKKKKTSNPRQSDSRDKAKINYKKGMLILKKKDGITEKRLERAILSLKKAAKGGHTEAQEQLVEAQEKLVRMYVDYDKKGFPKDYAKAFKLVNELIAGENPEPQHFYYLGWMYATGNGVSQDEKEAVKWYTKAANQENAQAQFRLGWAYEEGKGIRKNKKKAVEWYTKAANQEHAAAQNVLGFMCCKKKEWKKAMYWYRKAYDNGDKHAPANIGLLYAEGHGVKKDIAEANMWYQRAANRGQKKAKDVVGREMVHFEK